jgi:hypothetical protein
VTISIDLCCCLVIIEACVGRLGILGNIVIWLSFFLTLKGLDSEFKSLGTAAARVNPGFDMGVLSLSAQLYFGGAFDLFHQFLQIRLASFSIFARTVLLFVIVTKHVVEMFGIVPFVKSHSSSQ